MQKVIITLLTICFVTALTGCETETNNYLNEKEKCFSYKKITKDKVDMTYDSENSSGSKMVTKIFYSPKVGSCLYTTREYFTRINTPGENGTTVDYELYDLFTEERLIYEKGCDDQLHCGLSTTEAEKEFKIRLKKYE